MKHLIARTSLATFVNREEMSPTSLLAVLKSSASFHVGTSKKSFVSLPSSSLSTIVTSSERYRKTTKSAKSKTAKLRPTSCKTRTTARTTVPVCRRLGCRRSRVVTFTAIRLRGSEFKPRLGQTFENENFCFRRTYLQRTYLQRTLSSAVVKACHPCRVRLIKTPLYTPCLIKNCAQCFYQNFVKFSSILLTFGR